MFFLSSSATHLRELFIYLYPHFWVFLAGVLGYIDLYHLFVIGSLYIKCSQCFKKDDLLLTQGILQKGPVSLGWRCF